MKPLPFSPAKAARRGGFTLIEVIITLVVFILLTASVFGIMTAVFQSSNLLQANQNRRDEVTAFCSYLKSSFENLAANDFLLTYLRGDGDGLHNSGLILGRNETMLALDATRQDNGLYLLRLGRPAPDPNPRDPPPTLPTFRQQLEKNQSAVAWAPLIRDVRSIEWKFQPQASSEWTKDWTQIPGKPGLIECSIQLAGDDSPTTVDFFIPRLGAPSNPAPAAANGP